MNLLGIYLTFGGNAEEVLNYYSDVFATEKPIILRYEDLPSEDREAMGMEEAPKGIVHGSITINNSDIGASDMMQEGEELPVAGRGYTLTYTTNSIEENEKIYERMISDGGVEIMKPEETFWSPSYGILNDKFGLQWMIMVYNQVDHK